MNVKSSSGFTLIEILMVIVLVGIVSAVAIPQFIDFRSEAKATVTKDRMSSLRRSIVGEPGRTGYLSHMSAIPLSLSDLVTKGSKPTYDPINKLGWNGPYVDGTVADWDKDGWGLPYEFSTAARTIRSCGANATCGDGDDLVVTF